MNELNFPNSSAAMTVDEAAAYLTVSRATVWRLLKSKSLPRVRIGTRTVVRRVDLEAFLANAVDAA
jgi:excisionase family DNA binding protein